MSETQLTLNLLQGSVSFRFTPEAAQQLKTHIAELMQKLKAVAAKSAQGAGSGKPSPQKAM